MQVGVIFEPAGVVPTSRHPDRGVPRILSGDGPSARDGASFCRQGGFLVGQADLFCVVLPFAFSPARESSRA